MTINDRQEIVTQILFMHRAWVFSIGEIGARANFSSGTLVDLDFSGADLRGAYFNRARLVRCNFIHTKLDYAEFHFARMRDCDFDGARMSSVKMDGARIYRCNFESACMDRAVFCGADFRGCRLDHRAELAGAIVRGPTSIDPVVRREETDLL
jgi:uncharacterized protein YjbI with pentapeptide repeats